MAPTTVAESSPSPQSNVDSRRSSSSSASTDESASASAAAPSSSAPSSSSPTISDSSRGEEGDRNGDISINSNPDAASFLATSAKAAVDVNKAIKMDRSRTYCGSTGSSNLRATVPLRRINTVVTEEVEVSHRESVASLPIKPEDGTGDGPSQSGSMVPSPRASEAGVGGDADSSRAPVDDARDKTKASSSNAAPSGGEGVDAPAPVLASSAGGAGGKTILRLLRSGHHKSGKSAAHRRRRSTGGLYEEAVKKVGASKKKTSGGRGRSLSRGDEESLPGAPAEDRSALHSPPKERFHRSSSMDGRNRRYTSLHTVTERAALHPEQVIMASVLQHVNEEGEVEEDVQGRAVAAKGDDEGDEEAGATGLTWVSAEGEQQKGDEQLSSVAVPSTVIRGEEEKQVGVEQDGNDEQSTLETFFYTMISSFSTDTAEERISREEGRGNESKAALEEPGTAEMQQHCKATSTNGDVYEQRQDEDDSEKEEKADVPSSFETFFNSVISSFSTEEPTNDDDIENEGDLPGRPPLTKDQWEQLGGQNADHEYQMTRCASTYTAYTMDRSHTHSSAASFRPKKKKERYYYKDEDFDTMSWKKAASKSLPTSVGMAVVATATVIVHPLIFLAGAVWAVGLFHAFDQGYKFYSDGTFAALFWGDEEDVERLKKAEVDLMLPIEAASDSVQKDVTEEVSRSGGTVDGDGELLCDASKNSAKEDVSIKTEGRNTPTKNETMHPKTTSQLLSPNHPSSPSLPTTQPAPLAPSITTEQLMKSHFPPLEACVTSRVPFPNLHAGEFFRVFFSDSAPHSLKEFQAERGDIEISFGLWSKPSPEKKCDFDMPKPIQHNTTTVKERTLAFKTLTKSYFGPAYASAQKKQRVSLFHSAKEPQCMVLESYTRLIDIPFGDRFQVVDRWIVQTVRRQDGGEDDATSRTKKRKPNKQDGEEHDLVSYLTVYIEVQMIKSCSWEGQIRKRTESTMKELVNSWCKKATLALQLAEQHKAQRIRKELSYRNVMNTFSDNDAAVSAEKQTPSLARTRKADDAENDKENTVNNCNGSTSPERTNTEEEIMARHKSKLKELEAKVASGNEHINVEVYNNDNVELQHIQNKQCSGKRSVLILGPERSSASAGEGELIQCDASPELKNANSNKHYQGKMLQRENCRTDRKKGGKIRILGKRK